MTSSPDARNRDLTSTTATAASVPHLLGFHPRESLVCLWTRGGLLQAAQRADLPSGVADMSEYVDAYLRSAAMVPRDSFVAICFTDDEERGSALLKLLRQRSSDVCANCSLVKGAYVRDVTSEVPGAWEWIDARAREHARRTLAGSDSRNPLPSRNAMEAECASDPQASQLLGPLEDSDLGAVEELAIAVETSLSAVGNHQLVIDDRRLRSALFNVRGRDLMLEWAASVEPQDLCIVGARLFSLLRTCPSLSAPRERRAVANLAAAAAGVVWLAGDGARANVAVDRCLTECPDHRLGLMLDGVLRMGIPPSAFAQAVSGAT